MVGTAMLGPAFGAATVVRLAALAFTGPCYRWGLGKTTAELTAALAAVDASIRAFDIFGSAPPIVTPRPPSSSDDSFLLGGGAV